MRWIRVTVVACGLVLAGSALASAQDAGKVGLTVAYPSSVGVLWHVSERFALRPDFTVQWSSSETDRTPADPLNVVSSSDSTSFGVGVSALIYLSGPDALRFYVSPRFVWSHASGSAESSVTITQPPLGTPRQAVQRLETTGTSSQIAGSFGAQYLLGDRFAVFGEIGGGYSWSTTEGEFVGDLITGLTPPQVEGRTGGLRSGIGIIVYF